jgi:hypothetical protein
MKKGATIMAKPVVFGIVLGCILVGVVTAAVVNPASRQQTTIIAKAIKDPITVIQSAAIKSSRHLNAYYVGLSFVAHELEITGIGLWLVEGEQHKPEAVYSVNATAIVFSKFPKAHRIKSPARLHDHEAQLILDYFDQQ